MSESFLNNNALASLAQRAAPPVLQAIRQASAKTGVNFAYLMQQAAAESNFDAQAKAKTSSAAGLYQFIESTWLDMVKQHGHKYGLGDLAAKIGDNGKVADPASRREILALRQDPEKAALLAAEFAAENKAYLERHVGGVIGPTELYFAHFLGASGAAGFLKAMRDNPLQMAADIFPDAARANRNVFYDRKTGAARTLAGVYDFFDKKFSASESVPDIETEAAPPRPDMPDMSGRYRPGRAMDLADYLLSMKMPLSLSDSPNDNRASFWHKRSAAAPLPLRAKSLVFNPVELMLMAQKDVISSQPDNAF